MIKYFLSLILLIVGCSVFAQEKKFAQPDLKGDLVLDLGISYWNNDMDTTEAWSSRNIGIYYTRRLRISNKFSFYPGVGLGVQKLSFKKNYYLSNQDGDIAVDTVNASVSRNKLNITYLDIPLELRFHPNGTQEGEGFFVGAGVIGGIKLGAHTRLKYEQNGHRRVEKLQSNFGLNDIRYGVQFRVGWRGTNVFFKHFFSETFRNDQALVDPDFDETGAVFNPTTTQIGISFSGF